MFSGGDDHIIKGKFPTGQVSNRGAVFTTFPAASLAALVSLSLITSGLSLGLGTLLNQSVKLPDPGSCTSHIPEISRVLLCEPACPASSASPHTILATVR